MAFTSGGVTFLGDPPWDLADGGYSIEGTEPGRRLVRDGQGFAYEMPPDFESNPGGGNYQTWLEQGFDALSNEPSGPGGARDLLRNILQSFVDHDQSAMQEILRALGVTIG